MEDVSFTEMVLVLVRFEAIVDVAMRVPLVSTYLTHKILASILHPLVSTVLTDSLCRICRLCSTRDRSAPYGLPSILDTSTMRLSFRIYPVTS